MMVNQSEDEAGRILSVNVSREKGQKKHNVNSVIALSDYGIMGDAHAGMQIRQVSLLAEESIEKMRTKGLDVRYGDFAENFTTQGIILHELPVGTRIIINGYVILELTQIGKICHDRCAIFTQVGDCIMPREGVFAKVINGGVVKCGDTIKVIKQQAKSKIILS
jgi:MOSC domain-containing protein YiiM